MCRNIPNMVHIPSQSNDCLGLKPRVTTKGYRDISGEAEMYKNANVPLQGQNAFVCGLVIEH